MTDAPTSGMPGLGDLFALFGAQNVVGGVTRTIDQFKRGVNDLLASVETFNATMESLNGVATRINGLLDEVEEPIRAFLPQVTRSLQATDAIISQLSGPIERVAPGIARLADTLENPVFATMPADIGTFLDVLGDLSR